MEPARHVQPLPPRSTRSEPQHTRPDLRVIEGEAAKEKPIIHTEVAGAMKTGHLRERIDEHKLGVYGQDGLRINKATGTVVVFDGVEAYDNSFPVGEIIAEKIEQILNELPEVGDAAVIETYIRERFSELGTVLSELREDVQGAVSVVATRFLESARLIVCIKVGDGEIVMQDADGEVRELLAPSNDDKKRRLQQTIAIQHAGGTKKIIVDQPEILVTSTRAGTQVYTATDGVYNNTDQHLVDHVAAGSINDLMNALPGTSENITVAKDDVIIVKQGSAVATFPITLAKS